MLEARSGVVHIHHCWWMRPRWIRSPHPNYYIICLRCSYAIQPGAVPRHLKEIHHLHHSSRRAFVDYASGFELSQPKNLVLPDENQFPVPLLPVQNGLACSFAGCAHLSHEAALDVLQTFFRGNAFRYFTNPALLTSSSSNISDGLTNTTATTPTSSENRELSPYQTLITSDAGLLDHYRNYTYKTFSCGPETDDAFSIIIPQLATQFPFCSMASCPVLRSTLLLSTLQIERIIRFNQAAPAFRWATMHVDSNNSQAVLAFSFFLVVYALGSESNDQSLFLSNGYNQGEDVLEWIEILRNGCSMLCPVWAKLTTSPLASFTALWRDYLAVTTNPNDPLLISLLSVIPDDESESTDYYIYRDSAVRLTQVFTFIKLCGPSSTIWDVLYAWPMHVSPEYLALLKLNNPGALLLLAYYSILLQPLQGEWFLKGRVMKLIDEIARRLNGNCSPQIWAVFSMMQREYFASDLITYIIGGMGFWKTVDQPCINRWL
ncbi:transcriptional regulator family: Fungal Specific TF [Penicillium concentricum]|uniref:Transcriptional regulator family: Fungal Specific TF n=1 Tax=Penicillium concentricum TaxID=293559 RepID=A0A9W9SQ24_9EURO|nr:transcriptional regulator family: Fungal Specific TF [Penicillium concentricum]KAJ5382397.1 transcriptional regulator family: Fungal Specific TF [Penicillium concentricum]